MFPNHPRFRTFLLHQEPLPLSPEPVEAISGAFMMIRHQAIKEVGLLDENYFLHCEDIDWCMRFRQAGWNILFTPTSEVLHYKGACSKNHPIGVLYHMHRGMIRFYRKYFRRQYPLPLMAIVISTVWARFIALTSKEIIKYLVGKQSIGKTNAPSPIVQERRNPAPVIAYIGPERRTHNKAMESKLRSQYGGKREP